MDLTTKTARSYAVTSDNANVIASASDIELLSEITGMGPMRHLQT